MLKAAEKKSIKIIVPDRPNPIRGDKTEGPCINEKFLSFVGLHPLIIRHGLTFGEALKIIHREMNLTSELEVIPVKKTGQDICGMMKQVFPG